ncbi:DNA alkylation repair protein [Candidatus Micrarchaeota archaeon]|nr:DNA alkylation repair protein [Candidatus Micrarchaeota archaeon]
MKVAKNVSRELKALAEPAKALVLARFFKTGKGEYGEGDVFYGISVGQTRSVARKHARQAALEDVRALLHSRVHEERLAALLILVDNFHKAEAGEKKRIFDFYLRNAKRANNWDLVDLSAHRIVGAYLHERAGKKESMRFLKKLAQSESVWERRIAVLATFQFISKGDCEPALAIATVLLHDQHDLIRKAVGWMLREVGKRCSEKKLLAFLDEHAARMPRVALRYAIERLPEHDRKRYLKA